MRPLLLLLVFAFSLDASAQLTVVSTDPLGYGILPDGQGISFLFSEPVNPSSIDGMVFLHGEVSGPREWTAAFSENDRRLTLSPVGDYVAGERVQVQVPHTVRSTSGAALDHGYWITVNAAVSRGQLKQQELTRWYLKQPNEATAEHNGGKIHSNGLLGSDVNQDGWPDLSVASGWPSDVRFYLGGPGGVSTDPEIRDLGSGNFQTSGYWPIDLTASDLNRDGVADLLVVQPPATLMGVSGELLTSGVSLEGDGDCLSSVVFDADADGYPDILAAVGASLQVRRNDGSGRFSAWGDPLPTGFSGGPWECRVADLNLDGIADILAGRQSNEAAVFRGLGSGTYAEPERASNLGYWDVAQLDADGIPDLVYSDPWNDLLKVAPGGDFEREWAALITVDAAIGVRAADMDGDGDLDVVIGGWEGVVVHENQDADLSRAVIHELEVPVGNMVVTDRDLDGDLDITTLISSDWSGDPDELVLLENVAAPTWVEERPLEQRWRLYPNPTTGHIQLEAALPVAVEIFDVMGRLVERLPAGTGQSDVSR
ncbi:MAG: hypothetical protein HKN29_09700, partial [Rhodothermales bacterium]|nr:hypothetical protein [Rhodothermales bacterium]